MASTATETSSNVRGGGGALEGMYKKAKKKNKH